MTTAIDECMAFAWMDEYHWMVTNEVTPKSFIYGLIDPRTLLIRYIGQTSQGLKRPRAHYSSSKQLRNHCAAWIRQLRALGLRYQIVILEVVPHPAGLIESEEWWIAYGKLSRWPLTNLTKGGEGTRGYKAPPDVFEKNSARGKARFSDPAERDRQSKATREALARIPAEERRAWVERGAAVNRQPDRRAHNSAQATERFAQRPELGRAAGDRLKALWKDPDFKELVIASRRTPKARASNSAARRGKKPSKKTKAKMSASQTAAWANNPARREQQSERSRRLATSRQPHVRAINSARMTGDLNPSKRDDVRQKMREAWVRRKARKAQSG